MGKPGHLLGRNLKRLLKERGITNSEIAQAVEVSQAYVSMLKSGKVEEPALGVTMRLAAALGVPLSSLVEGATLDLPLPLPEVYYQKRYQLTNPVFIEFLERLAEAMAEKEQGIKSGGEGEPGKGVGLVSSAAYRLLDQIVAQEVAQASAGPERDDQLDEITQRWAGMSEEQRQMLVALVRQMSSLVWHNAMLSDGQSL